MAKIADEEVAHVAVGVYWFVSVCQKMGHTPDSTFTGCSIRYLQCVTFKAFPFTNYLSRSTDILDEYSVELKGPFNHSACETAGIPRDW